MKLLLWLVIGTFVIWYLRGKIRSSKVRRDIAGNQKKNNSPEQMIRCIHCDIYVPFSEATFSMSGTAFCCEEHRKKHI
jgi:hypothetical protein